MNERASFSLTRSGAWPGSVCVSDVAHDSIETNAPVVATANTLRTQASLSRVLSVDIAIAARCTTGHGRFYVFGWCRW